MEKLSPFSTLLLLLLISTDQVYGFWECPVTNGYFADPDSCRHFYQCENNVAYNKLCPRGSLYDGERLECVNRHVRPKPKCGPQPTTEATTTTVDPLEALPCDPTQCSLPYCFCSPSSTEIPGGLTPVETPQMIAITLDGSVNHLNYPVYKSIFLSNRTNGNGCAIKGTFFLSHDYSNYQNIEELYSEGHEMATGSVTRRAGLEDATYEEWVGEMVSMREILKNFANVVPEDILGMRAPNLKPGFNTQFEMLIDYDWVWDSSVNVPPVPIPVWPYTLDYKIGHECRSGTCPNRAHPGVWEIPFNSHYKDLEYEGGFCPYLDQCVLNYLSEAEVVDWLTKDFDKHYKNNRAPYMLSLASNWFQTPALHKGLLSFIDNTLKLPDVQYVTMTELLQWMASPTPIKDIKAFVPWQCDHTLPKAPCSNPPSCPLVLNSDSVGLAPGAGGTRYMVTCNNCPSKYPWVYDARGLGNAEDVYVPTYPGPNK